MYDVVECPACRGTGETPAGRECVRCEGYGGVEVCRADGPGQRESHDLRVCAHYRNVGQPA